MGSNHLDFGIQEKTQVEENWDILFEQIVKGNVIPVIGPELVRIGENSSIQFLIDAFAGHCGIPKGKISSFSQLVYDENFTNKKLADIHELLTINLNSKGNAEYFDNREDNDLLCKLLSIPYFPFVITTTFDPIVENMMGYIHGKLRLRVLTFRNVAGKNDDIENDEDTKLPTLYCFFWYAMKSDSFGAKEVEKGGMLAHTRQDSELIAFLTNQAKAFSQVEPNMKDLVNRICEGVAKAEKNIKPTTDAISRVPEQGADVFISYSRGDYELVEELYRILSSHGLNVWYDRQSLHHGLDFMRQIENAIRNSTFFVPVFTDTITKQTVKEHPYRKEWNYAVEHIQLIGGISYCFPFMAKGFNMDGLEEKVPN